MNITAEFCLEFVIKFVQPKIKISLVVSEMDTFALEDLSLNCMISQEGLQIVEITTSSQA
jgi:hypothetical protein